MFVHNINQDYKKNLCKRKLVYAIVQDLKNSHFDIVNSYCKQPQNECPAFLKNSESSTYLFHECESICEYIPINEVIESSFYKKDLKNSIVYIHGNVSDSLIEKLEKIKVKEFVIINRLNSIQNEDYINLESKLKEKFILSNCFYFHNHRCMINRDVECFGCRNYLKSDLISIIRHLFIKVFNKIRSK